jgi:hypothetical protein
MNIDDLRSQLDELAGPVPRATATARAAVGGRVRRARRRRNFVAGGTSALAAALVLGIVVIGLNGSNRSVNVRTTTPPATKAPRCTLGVSTVPIAQVPSAVAAWAGRAAVVGAGRLWTTRRALASAPIHDRGDYRLKIGWFATPFGIPTVTADRLDGLGFAHGNANAATDQRGKWVASTIELPAPGCWVITAQLGRSTIRFRRMIGNPARPLAIGTITGALEEVGGPAPGAPRGIAGTVVINNLAPSSEIPGCPPAGLDVACGWSKVITTDASGHFRADVPAGVYHVNGYSPQYQNDNGNCRGGDSVRVDTARTTRVEVVCPIR